MLENVNMPHQQGAHHLPEANSSQIGILGKIVRWIQDTFSAIWRIFERSSHPENFENAEKKAKDLKGRVAPAPKFDPLGSDRNIIFYDKLDREEDYENVMNILELLVDKNWNFLKKSELKLRLKVLLESGEYRISTFSDFPINYDDIDDRTKLREQIILDLEPLGFDRKDDYERFLTIRKKFPEKSLEEQISFAHEIKPRNSKQDNKTLDKEHRSNITKLIVLLEEKWDDHVEAEIGLRSGATAMPIWVNKNRLDFFQKKYGQIAIDYSNPMHRKRIALFYKGLLGGPFQTIEKIYQIYIEGELDLPREFQDALEKADREAIAKFVSTDELVKDLCAMREELLKFISQISWQEVICGVNERANTVECLKSMFPNKTKADLWNLAQEISYDPEDESKKLTKTDIIKLSHLIQLLQDPWNEQVQREVLLRIRPLQHKFDFSKRVAMDGEFGVAERSRFLELLKGLKENVYHNLEDLYFVHIGEDRPNLPEELENALMQGNKAIITDYIFSASDVNRLINAYKELRAEKSLVTAAEVIVLANQRKKDEMMPA